jgi:HK97 gp10 family phage protein
MALVTSKTVKVEGLSETIDGLEELTSATQANVMRRVLLQAGQPIADAAIALAPRGPTGKLIASISVTPAQPSKMTRSSRGQYDKQNTVEVVVEAGPVPSSIFMEFGTVHNAAQPFMRPAWLGNREQALQIITEQMTIEIEKARARAELKAARIAAKIAAG